LRDKPRESGLNGVIWAAICLIQVGRALDSILGQLTTELDQAIRAPRCLGRHRPSASPTP
jgi:hypothetical protein